MIDATKITKFNQTRSELEEFILFWICAAGKNGVTASQCLDRLLTNWWLKIGMKTGKWLSPFQIISEIDRLGTLPDELKRHGIGCYRLKAQYFRNLLSAELDLHTCTVEQLEAVKGIGPKTARCFLIHSRPRQKYAGLDRHILSGLRDLGYEVPQQTPSKAQYARIEKIFLGIVKKRRTTVAKLDLAWWNKYRQR